MRKPLGFTLIETIIAMAIMASGLLLLVNTWGGAFVRIDRTQKQFEVATLLERKMIDYELKYRGKNISEIIDEEDGEFDGYPEYKWKMSSKKLEFPDLAASLTSRDGGADQMTITAIRQLTDTLSKAIKELTVTVTYSKKGKKPIEHSITTYFVNYDTGVPGMPGGAGAPAGAGQPQGGGG